MPVRAPLAHIRNTQPARLLGALHLEVPCVRQTTLYTCGAASAVAALRAFDQPAHERALAKELRSSPQTGTLPANIVAAMKARGLGAVARTGLGLPELRSQLERGALVLVAYQAWRDDEKTPWRDHWDDGHYSVVTGMDDKNVYLMDPSMDERGFVPHEEFKERWHDVDGNGVTVEQLGIVIDGARAAVGARPTKVSRVD